MKPNQHYNTRFLWSITLTAAMGGFLFGYDWVVVGGAKPFFELYFELETPAQVGWAMSSALLGCLIGSVVSGILSDRMGRKKLLVGAGLLFVVSAFGTALASQFVTFVLYRILGGIGIGLASNLSPMYIAEVSPAEKRGMFVSVNQLTIVIGVLSAQLVNWLLAEPVADQTSAADLLMSWNGRLGWRYMFGVEAVPAAAFFALMFFVPESPRWLVKNGNSIRAREILARIGGDMYANSSMNDIELSLRDDVGRVHFRSLLNPPMLKIVGLGVFLAVLQQWCGINTVFYYAQEVFSAAGYEVSDILFNIVITGVVMLVFTFIAIRKVDQWGRRVLMLTGAGGLTIIYIALGAAYRLQWQGPGIVALVVLAVACYSFTLAPITWVLISEIFPNRIRGAAVSTAVFALWAASFLLTYTFPFLNEGLGTAGTYWLYAGICAVGYLVIKLKLPETKSKSLELIERELVGIERPMDGRISS